MNSPFDLLFERANAHLRNGEYALALDAFKQAKLLEGANVRKCLEGQALSNCELEAYPSALEAVEGAIRLSADNWPINNLLYIKGRVLKRMGLMKEAAEAYVLAADSEFAGYVDLYNCACACCYDSNPEAAIPFLESAILLNPERGIAAAAADEDFLELRKLPQYHAMLERTNKTIAAYSVSELLALPCYQIRLQGLERAAASAEEGEVLEEWIKPAVEVLVYAYNRRAIEAYSRLTRLIEKARIKALSTALGRSIGPYLEECSSMEQYEKAAKKFLSLGEVIPGFYKDFHQEWENCILKMLTDISEFPATFSQSDRLNQTIFALISTYNDLNWSCGHQAICPFADVLWKILGKHLLSKFTFLNGTIFVKHSRGMGLQRLIAILDQLAYHFDQVPSLNATYLEEIESIYFVAKYFPKYVKSAMQIWSANPVPIALAEGYWKIWIAMSENSTAHLYKDSDSRLVRPLHQLLLAKFPDHPLGQTMENLLHAHS